MSNKIKILSLLSTCITRCGKIASKTRPESRFYSLSPAMGCKSSKEFKINRAATSSAANEDEYITQEVCCESDLKENEMKAFDVQDMGKVLLVRQKGKIHALGSKCSHYGANLANGALGNGRIRCQWHGACFNVETGDIEDFPGMDSLPCHQVIIDRCKVKVKAKRSDLQAPGRTKPMSKRDPDNSAHYVVIGGGPSAAVCVETLRQERFTGKITMVCKERSVPYDRVKVSKSMNFDVEKNQLRSPQFYQEHDIELHVGVEATGVNTAEQTVTLSNSQVLTYDHLYVATGSSASKLKIPGADLKNVVTIRTFEDNQYLSSQLGDDKNIVINGSSFIAMEAAASCVDKVKSVTMILRAKAPFKTSLGEEIGYAFMKLFMDKGVLFRTNSSIREIVGDDGRVVSTVLDDGTVLDTDLLIMGVGSSYYTSFLKDSGIKLRENGSIEVNEYLRTNVPKVYAGGDIAYAPVFTNSNEKASIGHYPLAHYHGRIAALNMLDVPTKLQAVPYFWTMLFGKGVRYAGHGRFEDIIYVGEVIELKFVAFYVNGNNEVVAASSCGMDPIVSQFAELLYQGRKLTRQDLEKDPLAWTKTVAAPQ